MLFKRKTMSEVRYNWTKEEIRAIYDKPFMNLVFDAANVHRENHNPLEVQVSTLLSVKTGGCPEDCSYCPQAARYHTDVKVQKLLPVNDVVKAAVTAQESGSTRFCMGAAWREVRDNSDFDKVLDMVKGVNALGMEVCCTLGMLTDEQAGKLKEAGLHAYNHNLDTSEDKYDEIISTRSYADRLSTLDNVRNNKLSVCTGGIIGLGESIADRVSMIHTLATLPEHPDSVPVNALVPVEGTPLENQPLVPIWDMVRMIATARIVMPKAKVRLSAGRTRMGQEGQALCFMAGANSIFAGDKLLTTPNPEVNEDKELFSILGLVPEPSKKKKVAPAFDQIPMAQK